MRKNIIIPALLALGFNSCALSSVSVGSIINSQQAYFVSFNTDGGSFIETQEIYDGGRVIRPFNPTKKGYSFDGWYTDESKITKFEFETRIHSDTVLYAKWADNYHTFEFESQDRSCMVSNKFHFIEKVNKDEKEVKYTITAKDGYQMPKDTPSDFPEGVTYTPSGNLHTANITITEMDKDYTINLKANAASKVSLTLTPGATCTINDKDEEQKLEFLPGTIDRVFYIKPKEGYAVPTLGQLNIHYDGDSKDYDYDGKGTLTIHRIFGNFSVSPNLFESVKFTAYASYGTFKLQSSKRYQDEYTHFNGNLDSRDVTESKDLEIYYKMPNLDEYELLADYILVSVDGKQLSKDEFELKQMTGLSDFLITVHNFTDYENVLINIQTRFTDNTRIVQYSHDKTPNFSFWDILVNGSTGGVIHAPANSGLDYYVKVTVKTNSNSLYKIKAENIKFTSDGQDLPFILVAADAEQTYGEFFINLKNIDNFHICLADVEVPLKLNDLNFYQIKDLADSLENPDDYFNIGDEKQITLSYEGKEENFKHTVRIIDFNHDGLSFDDSRKTKITFEFKDLITVDGFDYTSRWDTLCFELPKAGAIFEDYDGGLVDKFLNGEFINDMLPDDLAACIESVIKNVITNNGADEIRYKTKPFLISYKELTGNDFKGTNEDDSKIYSYYETHNTDADRIKKYVNGKEAKTYYTRTCKSGFYEFFDWEDGKMAMINEKGQLESIGGTHNFYFPLAPCFCIGRR